MHALIRRVRRDETGVAVAIAMLTLLVVGTLSAILLASAMQASQSGVNNRNDEGALQVANAGLQLAVSRLSAQPVGSVKGTDCFTTTDVGAPGPTGCPADTESYGQGTLSYWVSPDLAQTPNACTGLWVQSPDDGIDIEQRCITATGTVHGITRRVQERVAALTFTFPVSGILSYGNLKLDTANGTLPAPYGAYSAVFNGNVEANGTITITNKNDLVTGNINWGPSGSFVPPSGFTCSSPCTESQVSPAYQRPAGAAPQDYISSSLNNDDAMINWGTNSKWWNTSTRTVNAGAASGSAVGSASNPLVIPGGVYNFCSFTLNGTYVEIPSGQSVVIYIDNSKNAAAEDAQKAGSGCPTGGADGVVNENNDEFYNPNRDPGTLQIRVYGQPGWTTPPTGGIGKVDLNDDLNPPGGQTYGDVYAPDSYVTTSGKGLRWSGGIVAANFESNDNDIIGAAPGYTNNPTHSFYGTAYHECATAATSGSDPGSGCY